jgi:hypothetical protein
MQDVQVAAEFAQSRTQVGKAVPDEFHAAVGTIRKLIEDVGIEHEHAMHRLTLFERVIQSGMVRKTQIAAQPADRVRI